MAVTEVSKTGMLRPETREQDMSKSLISCDIDLEGEGKRSGYLRVPHSTHESAYGWIGVPVTVIRNGDGPTLLYFAGVHGDEYEGQIALTKLAAELQPEDMRGRLIVLPAVNAPASRAALRTSPIDGVNLNRAFPGEASGTPSQMLAHYLEEVLIPLGDVLVDLHSGGTSLFYPPTLLRGQGHSEEEKATLLQLQAAFDLPYAWVFQGGGGRNSTARTAMGAGNRNGLVTLMAELGGGGQVDPRILAQTERGLRRIMASLEMLPGFVSGAPRGTRELHAKGLVCAFREGVFEPLKDIGDPVEEGETVGFIRAIETSRPEAQPVVSQHAGIVLCKRTLARVALGDALFQIAADA